LLLKFVIVTNPIVCLLLRLLFEGSLVVKVALLLILSFILKLLFIRWLQSGPLLACIRQKVAIRIRLLSSAGLLLLAQ